MGAAPVVGTDECRDHRMMAWNDMWNNGRVVHPEDDLLHYECERCWTWVPVAYLCLNTGCSAKNNLQIEYSRSSVLKSSPADYFSNDKNVKVVKADMTVPTAPADDASDATGDDDGVEASGDVDEQHRGCDVLYDTSEGDFGISCFSNRLTGSFQNFGRRIFVPVRWDTVNLSKYALRRCCRIQLFPGPGFFDTRYIFCREGRVVSDQVMLKETPARSLYEVNARFAYGTGASHGCPILDGKPIYGTFDKPVFQILVDKGYLPAISSYKLIAHNGKICSNEYVRYLIEAAAEQFEWQRKAMTKEDFSDMAKEYCQIWCRDYGLGWNSFPDASEIIGIHVDRQKHQALASRLTMIVRAYMLRFTYRYSVDQKVQRNHLSRLAGLQMTGEMDIDRDGRNSVLTTERPKHILLMERHERLRMPQKDNILNNVEYNKGKFSNFLTYVTALSTSGEQNHPDSLTLLLKLVDPTIALANVRQFFDDGSEKAFDAEVDGALVATTQYERSHKEHRWMVQCPAYKTEEVVWADVAGWPGLEVKFWCYNLQNRRCMDAILLTAGLGSWDGVLFGRKRVPVVNGPDRWEDDNVRIGVERQQARCRPWDGDPMYVEKNLNTMACAMDLKIIDIGGCSPFQDDVTREGSTDSGDQLACI